MYDKEISGVFSLLFLANLCVGFFCVNWDCTALSSFLTPLLILNIVLLLGAGCSQLIWRKLRYLSHIGHWDSVLCLKYLPALGFIWKFLCMAIIFNAQPACTNILWVWNSTILTKIYFYIAILYAILKSFKVVFVVCFESRETVSNTYCNTSLHLDPWLDWKNCQTDLPDRGTSGKKKKVVGLLL